MSKSLVFRGKTTNYGGALESILVAYFLRETEKPLLESQSMEAWKVMTLHTSEQLYRPPNQIRTNSIQQYNQIITTSTIILFKMTISK